MKDGTRAFITVVMDSDRYRCKGVFSPHHLFPLQVVLSNPIDTEPTEIGNADIAANVLGCAAKVPSFPPSHTIFS